eukprot:TRINITY_DN22588_c0_g1_i1.p1 TRINITY_DN22588_c0_g1~~TRINITY_DN22588_c0_g1_i1.p1  ORF type:complete len:127 (+),score=27.01 TRINITY_DN22588_c0_g1_i1:104-484(+)
MVRLSIIVAIAAACYSDAARVGEETGLPPASMQEPQQMMPEPAGLTQLQASSAAASDQHAAVRNKVCCCKVGACSEDAKNDGEHHETKDGGDVWCCKFKPGSCRAMTSSIFGMSAYFEATRESLCY